MAAAPRIATPDAPLAQLLPRHYDRGSIALTVEKHAYRLTVRYRGKAVKSYPIVLGADPVDDKLREGDNCTPEGRFHIAAARPHRSWSYFLLLDYPTAESWRKHWGAVRRGIITRKSAIGGAVGIHGVPRGYDGLIDERTDWTAGCIALRTADIAEVYRAVRVGTGVTIVR